MKRRLLNLLTALSLLLLAATGVLWVASYWGSHSIGFERIRPPGEFPGSRGAGASTVSGVIQVESLRQVYEAETYPPHWWAEIDKGWTWQAGWNRYGNGFRARLSALASRPVLGFRFWDAKFDRDGAPGRSVGIIVPFWALTAVWTVLPILWARRAIRSRRVRLRRAWGLCVACGYDLRGSRGACPECGAAAPPREGLP
jgi:hypothetical protein